MSCDNIWVADYFADSGIVRMWTKPEPKQIDWTRPVREKVTMYLAVSGEPRRSARLLGKLKGSNFNMVAFDNGSHESFLQMTDDEVLEKLENTPSKKIVQYLNIRDGQVGGAYNNRADADAWATGNRSACIRVEIEEGRFDG